MRSDNLPELWDAGPGGMVSRERVVAVGRFDSAPVRRAVRKARENDRLIDLTFGYACRWVFFLDTGQIVLSANVAWPAVASGAAGAERQT